MPQATFAIANFNQASYFKSWTGKDGDGTIHRGYTTPSNNTQSKSVVISGLPAGAVINWATINFSADTGTYGGTQTPASGAGVSASPGGTTTISFYWKSNTGGSYPAVPSAGNINYLDKTGLLQLTDIYVLVDYTESGAPPPATGFSLSSTNIDAGQALTAYISPVSDYQYSIVYSYYGGAPFHIVPYLGPGTYYDVFSVPMSFVNSIPNAARALCTAELTTVSADGTTQISKKSIDFYINVPASVVPTLTGLTATLVSNGVDASITRYVQNYSKCLIEITGAAGTYDSTIVSYKITGGGYTINAVSGTIGTFGTAGDLTFTATVTDSRGRTATATVTITVDAYGMPSLTDISAFRCDEYGTADRSGAYVLLKATPVIASIGGQNTAALAGRVYMKGGTPGTPEAMVSNTASILGGGLLLPVKTYIAEIIVQDLINSANYIKTIPTDRVALHFLDSISAGAINKYAEIENAFEIAWPMLMLDGGPAAKYEIGDILITLNSTSPASRFPGTTWAALEGMFLLGADGTYTAGSTGGAATHTLSVAEIPSHRHVQSYIVYNLVAGGSGQAVMSGGTAGDTPSYQNTQYTGGGAAHNNMPPFLAVYMWERTA